MCSTIFCSISLIIKYNLNNFVLFPFYNKNPKYKCCMLPAVHSRLWHQWGKQGSTPPHTPFRSVLVMCRFRYQTWSDISPQLLKLWGLFVQTLADVCESNFFDVKLSFQSKQAETESKVGRGQTQASWRTEAEESNSAAEIWVQKTGTIKICVLKKNGLAGS